MFGRRRGTFDLPRRSRGAWRSPSFIHARADESVGEGGRSAASKNRSGHFRLLHPRTGRINSANLPKAGGLAVTQFAARLLVGERVPSSGDQRPPTERHDEEDEKNQGAGGAVTNARRARRRRPASASLVLERRSHSPLSAATQQPRSGRNVHRGALGPRGRKARAEQHRALPGVKMPAPNAWQQGGPETWSISGPPGPSLSAGGPRSALTDPRRRQATSLFGRADQTSVIRPNPGGSPGPRPPDAAAPA